MIWLFLAKFVGVPVGAICFFAVLYLAIRVVFIIPAAIMHGVAEVMKEPTPPKKEKLDYRNLAHRIDS